MNGMDPQQLIGTYERILDIADAMLSAAREDDWDRVGALEQRCRGEVERLIALGEGGPPLPQPLRERKLQIVRRVLADDAEIRRIAEPRMAELEQLFGQAWNERRLLRSYGASP
jgi:flagellar protein FliT